jgi:dissimilatory sulfite reductase (desulfoviridin) alpha/beta subunit
MSTKKSNKYITVLLSAGRLTQKVLSAVQSLQEKYGFDTYFTTMQNLRLLGIAEEDREDIKRILIEAGATIKGPGMFPMPRICVGQPYCNLALVDTKEVSDAIWNRFGGRTGVKSKFKIAVAACPACCSGPVLTDIGIVATRSGYDVYVGGKGGPRPKAGRRIARKAGMDEVLDIIGKLADFHHERTAQKSRMSKLINEEGFPFPDAV